MKNAITTAVFSLNVLLLSALLALSPRETSAQGKGLQYDLVSPLNATSAEELITAILGVLIVIATPIVVIFIVYAGFLYVTAQGNTEQVKKATRALTYAIIGGILIIGAVALSGIIQGVVTAFKAP